MYTMHIVCKNVKNIRIQIPGTIFAKRNNTLPKFHFSGYACENLNLHTHLYSSYIIGFGA